jgi:parvulin-like peptidyl-prolyl isomerase
VPFRKIALTTLAALSLQLTADAQTRRPRPAPARTPAPPAAAAGQRTAAPAAPAAQGAINLTARDMSLVVEGLNLPPEARGELASSPEERKTFARDIRQMLATAEEAKAAGYLARPDLKLQTELSRAFVIAQTYFKQRQDAGASDPEQVVTPAEIDAFLKEPATAPQFEAFVQDYQKNGPGKGAPITEAQRKELGQHYGRVMVAMRKGVAAGLDRDRKTQLVVMLQQARLLAGAYSKELAPRFKVTDAEVDAYVAAHPEYNTGAERAKLEDILKRVRAGEDFGKLAREFSDDPGSKAQGGDLGWFGRGVMVKPFEDAAFALKDGQVSEVFESPFGYHIVQTQERRTKTADDGRQTEEVHARHILVKFNNASRGPDGRPLAPRDAARARLEEEKRHRLLDDIAARRRVQVAEDFDVGAHLTGGGVAPPPAPMPERRPAGAQPPADARSPAAKTIPAPAPARRRRP